MHIPLLHLYHSHSRALRASKKKKRQISALICVESIQQAIDCLPEYFLFKQHISSLWNVRVRAYICGTAVMLISSILCVKRLPFWVRMGNLHIACELEKYYIGIFKHLSISTCSVFSTKYNITFHRPHPFYMRSNIIHNNKASR